MAKGEITIDVDNCTACGYCAHFCARGSISMVGNHAVFSKSETCNGCGVCGWMCSGFAIEVYKFADSRR